jgi:hypothetical protein
VAAEVTEADVKWPELLTMVDDVPPATIITSLRRAAGKLLVRGISHDNGEIVRVQVNGQAARITTSGSGVLDWEIEITAPADGAVVALASDASGNVEQTSHRLSITPARVASAKTE